MVRRARDVLIDILRDEGITRVFGNPGSTEMPLMDALVDAPDIDAAKAKGVYKGRPTTRSRTHRIVAQSRNGRH